MKSLKVPMRMCLGCNEMKPKKELMRVVKSPESEMSLDFTGKKMDEELIFVKIWNVLIRQEKHADLRSHFHVG